MRVLRAILMAVLVVALLPTPAYPVAKEIIRIEAAVARLESDMRDMRSTLDERMGMMRQLMEQTTDAINKLNVVTEQVQRSIQGSVAAQGAKVDSVAGNVQGLQDSLEDVKARLSKLSNQVAQVRESVETLRAPSTPGSGAGAPPQSPEELYQNGLRDLQGGKLELALQQFQDYLRYYPETELAGNAQFYVGEVLYRQGKPREAIEAYDLVLERYPNGNKTAGAHLKKGFALLELKRRTSGVRELRELIRRFPRSEEAKLARQRLRRR
jgi:tol-pal system protein YbgF